MPESPEQTKMLKPETNKKQQDHTTTTPLDQNHGTTSHSHYHYSCTNSCNSSIVHSNVQPEAQAQRTPQIAKQTIEESDEEQNPIQQQLVELNSNDLPILTPDVHVNNNVSLMSPLKSAALAQINTPTENEEEKTVFRSILLSLPSAAQPPLLPVQRPVSPPPLPVGLLPYAHSDE
jgi:hypothetical protein